MEADQAGANKVFDAWYFTPGAVFGAYPGPLDRHAFVTGVKSGFPPR